LLVLVWFVVVVSNQINLTFEVFMSSTFIRSAMTGVAFGIFGTTFPSLMVLSTEENQKICWLSLTVACVMLWFDHRKAKGTKKAPKRASGVKAKGKNVVNRGRSKSGRNKRRRR
jgi:hypothetical protein